MEERIVEASIKQSILKNGFPGKIVRLPFKPVYESCKQHGTSLNQVFKNLEKESILGIIQGDHILFRSPEKTIPEPSSEPVQKESNSPFDFSQLKDLPNLENFEEMSRKYMANMTPEQMADVRKMVESMSEEDKAKILNMFGQMGKRP